MVSLLMPALLQNSPLQYLPSEIGLAASHSAVELDCALNNAGFGFNSTRQLAKLIRNAQEGDLVVEGAIYRSLVETRWRPNLQKTSEAAQATDELLELMSNPDGISPEDHEKILDFCLALLNQLAGSRASAHAFEMQMPHMR